MESKEDIVADLPARDLVAATPAGVRNKPGDPEDNANPARVSATNGATTWGPNSKSSVDTMTATIDVDAPTHSLWDARMLIPPDVFAGDSRNSHRGHPTGATDAPSTQMFDNKVRRRLANCLDDTSDATTPTEWRQYPGRDEAAGLCVMGR